ncbi:MAG: sigma-54-dependent Fis family transcriptional regulator [Acidobacteriaceae bacterium]|nr:sigma-54-dependent Fis family transcriptional regulator [Acidobacteriaceae bacterium]
MPPRHRILVVDDDQTIREYLCRYLSSRGYSVDCLASGHSVVSRLTSINRPSLVLLDLLMPQMSGLAVLAEMLKLERPVPAIVVSGVGQTSTVVDAMRMGACNYLLKPIDEEQLEQAIQRALTIGSNPPTKIETDDGVDIICNNQKLRRVQDLARQVANTDVPVLIVGESGVGKEVLARYIHSVSVRRKEPFNKVNCAAIPADLLEAEFFGYEAGAFTGAVREKPGQFELAGNGTIVLDEIGEMNCHLQAKLLHVLQDGEYSRIGGVRRLRLQARILALTNHDLASDVRNGEFRKDLYFRLNVVRVEIPPLRERPEDIPSLCHYFAQKYYRRYNRPEADFPERLVQQFCKYSWPGNVRQLENAVKRFVIIPDAEALLSELSHSGMETQTEVHAPLSLRDTCSRAFEQTEKEIVFRTLEEVNWNRKLAAERLGVCYKSLLNKLKKWEVPAKKSADWTH